MKIIVTGTGCKTCKNLHLRVKEVTDRNYYDVDLKYVGNLVEMIELGVSQSPALLIDGVIVSQGRSINEQEIKELIESHK